MLRSDAYLPAAGAKLELDPRMTESSDTSDTLAKSQDYVSLRAELAVLVNDFTPVINELWPRLEDHKYRWELPRELIIVPCRTVGMCLRIRRLGVRIPSGALSTSGDAQRIPPRPREWSRMVTTRAKLCAAAAKRSGCECT